MQEITTSAKFKHKALSFQVHDLKALVAPSEPVHRSMVFDIQGEVGEVMDKQHPDSASDGEKLVALIIGSQQLFHRRVDALRLGSNGTTRRYVSLDFTIPERLVVKGSTGRMIVPLGQIQKRSLRRLDATDSSGKSLSILETPNNSGFATEFLAALAPQWAVQENLESLKEAIFNLVCSEGRPWEVEDKFKRLTTILDGSRPPKLSNTAQLELKVYKDAAKQLGFNSLLMAEMDASLAGTRTIAKYSLDQNTPPHSRFPSLSAVFELAIPDFGLAGSQHVEVEVPEGLVIKTLLMLEEPTNLKPLQWDAPAPSTTNPREPRRVGHVSLRPSTRESSGSFYVEVTPAKQGLLTLTALSIIVVSFAVVLGWLIRNSQLEILSPLAKIPSPSASILLVLPALLLSWTSRKPEHPLVTSQLKSLRSMISLCTITVFLLAALAAIPVTAGVWNATWWVLTVVQAASLLWYVIYVVDPGRRWPTLPMKLKSIWKGAIHRQTAYNLFSGG